MVAEIVIQRLERQVKNAKIDELEQGLKPNGNIIGKYRNLEYGIMKYNINPKAQGNVDLILTGSFSSKMFVVPTSRSKFTFLSNDDKSDSLQKKYGSEIMGLNQDTFDELLKREALPLFIQEIKKYVQ